MNVTPDLLKQCTDGMANTVAQPSLAAVSSVCEYTGVTQADATTLLKKWPNWQDAVSHYYDDPVNSLREEAPLSRQWEPADNIPYANDMSMSATSMTMSRPPSRNEQFPAMANSRSDFDSEQDEINRALAASMQELPGQESGVISSGQQFGPANRPFYDPSQWAMTAPIASSREVFEHPPPAKRRKIDGQPTFLRGSAETGYLAPLLTIYSSIPLAREAFLFPNLQVYSYGHDPSWWSGSTDENNKAISVEHSTNGDDPDRRNLLSELQCLMAFLEGSDRAYGSVDALADLRAYKNFQPESEFVRLLESWKHVAMAERPDEQLTQVFTSIAVKDQGSGVEPAEKPLVCLESRPIRREAQNLTDLLDMVVWNDSADLPFDEVWMEQVGEIFTMHFYAADNHPAGLGIDITELWYPDRYMQHMKEPLRQLREERMVLFQEINRLQRVQHSLTEMSLPNGQRRDIRKTVELALDNADVAGNHLLPQTNDLQNSSESPINIAKMKAEMTGLLARINDKWDQIQAKRAELYAQTRQITAELTMPSPDGSNGLRHKYILQGVATKPNITYVRRPKDILIDFQEQTETDVDPSWQWWRIAWNETTESQTTVMGPQFHDQQESQKDGHSLITEEGSGSAYSIRQVTAREVCEAAKTEHNAVVLVYANEHAMNFKPRPISGALRQFVEQDNQAFREEIQQGGVGKLKGRGRSWSEDTNDTVNEHDAFQANGQSHEQIREMTPMSMSTIRDSDGQPSPKRPRSSDASTPEPGQPPPYEDSENEHEMQEKKGNRIGLFANQLLEKYGGEDNDARMGATGEL